MSALFLHERQVGRRHARVLEELGGGRDHGARHGLILVAGEEVDVVVGKSCQWVDLAMRGELLGALGERLRVQRSRRGLHALVKRLLSVLQHRRRPEGNLPARLRLSAAVRAAGDNAGALDVFRVGDLNLPRHISP